MSDIKIELSERELISWLCELAEEDYCLEDLPDEIEFTISPGEPEEESEADE